MKLIYLHGFNSDANSNTVTELRKQFPDIITLSYNYENAEIGYNDIYNLIKQTYKNDPDIILLGTSLGGFWANFFGQKFDLKAIIVNPVIKPSVSLLKYVGVIKNYSTGKESDFKTSNAESYKKFETKTESGYFRYIVLGKNDKVLDYKDAEKYFKDKGKIIFTNDEHRISDFDKLRKIVYCAENNYPFIDQ